MNALAKIDHGIKLAPAIDVLKHRARARALLWWNYQIADLPEAIDPLQAYAIESGLLQQLGQNEIQRIISEPFAILRKSGEQEELVFKRKYYTPRSTIDAFLYLVGLNDQARLKRWLADRPKDIRNLQKLLEDKCPPTK
jgi:hypothetical protein